MVLQSIYRTPSLNFYMYVLDRYMKEQQSLPLEVESKQVIAWSVTISLILF